MSPRQADGETGADRKPSGETTDEVDDPAERARNVCLRLLTTRARSRAELARALATKDVPDEIVESVLDRYAEIGLVDDSAFAEMYVRSARRRGLARTALGAQLRRRGLADEIVRAAVDQVDGAAEEQTARELVRRRLRGMATAPPRTRVRRLVAMLGRKGYPEGVAWRVVREEVGAGLDELGEPGEPGDAG